MRLSLVLFAVLGVVGGAAAAAPPPELDAGRFMAHYHALTQAPNRLAGTPADKAAGDYIEAELRKLPGRVLEQRLVFPQQIVDLCELRLAGGVLPLEPLQANGLQPSVTPTAGITGKVIYIGKKSPRDAAGVDFDGAIVVSDFDNEHGIDQVFRLGAKAMIYVGDKTNDRAWAVGKRSRITINIPRFYVNRAAAEKRGLFTADKATIVSQIHWEKRAGRNLFLWIPGANPVFKEAPEYLILSSSYDSEGLVPTNSPMPDTAANCAALLETAARLAKKPPRRSVLIAFFDNHANFMEGGRRFYVSLRRMYAKGLNDPLAKRLEYVKDERAFIKTVLASLNRPNIFKAPDEVDSNVWKMLADEARYRYEDYQELLFDMRLQVGEWRKEKAAKEKEFSQTKDASLQVQIDDLDKRINALAVRSAMDEREKNVWRFVRESIRNKSLSKQKDLAAAYTTQAPDSVTLEPIAIAEVRRCFDRTRQSIIDRLTKRLAGLDEIEVERREDQALAGIIADATPVFHVAYRFTSGGDRWLFSPLGTENKRLYAALLDRAKSAFKDDLEGTQFVWASERASGSESASPAAYTPLETYDESLLALPFSIPTCTLITEQDRAEHWGMPDVTVSDAAIDRVRRQASHWCRFLDLLTQHEWASVPNRIMLSRNLFMDDYVWENDKAEGPQVRSFAFGQTSANAIEPYVVVHVSDLANKYPDYYVYTDANGCFPLMPLADDRSWGSVRLAAAKVDKDGAVRAISTYVPSGGRGAVGTWEKASYYGLKARTGFYALLPVFGAAPGRTLPMGTIVGRNLPFSGAFEERIFQLLNGLSNADYKRQYFRYDQTMGVGIYYLDRPMGAKFIYKDPKVQDEVALYLNNKPGDKEAVRGLGYGPGSKASPPQGPYMMDLRIDIAPDMFVLNESRLDALRRRNIILNFYEELQSQAKHLKSELDAARAEKRHARAEIRAGQVSALERRIYTPVMETTNDMVKAVTILLLLTIPFAFSLQNLILASYNVYRKIAGFILLFLLSFVILYFTHPAFSFAPTPIIIFLAFFIMVMSGAVIWIISERFRYEVKKLQGLATAAHTFQRSFFGNLGAAAALAFSTMRRRPVRTLLTVITALLLTFTILTFAAFQTEQGINRYYRGSSEGDQSSRLMLHRKVWKTMDEREMEDYRDYLSVAADAEVHGRYWRVRELSVGMSMEELYIPVTRVAGGESVAGALMTLDGAEIRNIRGLSEVLPGGVDDFVAGKGAYLPKSMADEMGAKPGDKILIDGVELTYLGPFDSRKLLAMRQVDGSPLLPVDFAMTQMAIGRFESKGSASTGDPQADLEAELAQLEAAALEPVSVDTLAIVPASLARKFGMALKAMVIYPREGEDIDRLAERLAILFDDGVYVNKGGETSFYLYGVKPGVSGAADVAIPLVLGGLIVFSTMLGSVIDREKEIYTFSALGLAPRNIAMLFFVEAGIYAVIGGFGGYLLSQLVTRLLEFLASYGIIKALEMNYSSSTAIITILIVMATVIVSTIYPAVQAARKATAETSRRWRIPAPKGNVLTFGFPFTISRFDITGIICFIREHFVNHADRTVGKFAADNLEVFREPQHGMAGLRATVWLQPFDQGLSQTFELTARPSDIEEVCEVHIRIERLSGPPTAWRRSNALFLEDLRSQFLLWRTLEDANREHYLSLADTVEESLGIVVEGRTGEEDSASESKPRTDITEG